MTAKVWNVLGVGLTFTFVSHAAIVDVTGGMTSAVLDTSFLSSAGLTLSSVSPDVIDPGSLPGSVGFGINARDAAPPALPTTFSYDSADFLNTLSGALEHTGSVFFNGDTVEVGDFAVGYDANRIVAGTTSGFYVESTVGLNLILFDLAPPSTLDAQADALTIAADLLVSPEFAAVITGGILLVDPTYSDTGDILIEAVPEPATGLLVLLGTAALWRRR